MHEFEDRIQIALDEIDFMIAKTEQQLARLRDIPLKPGWMEMRPRGRRFYYYLVSKNENNEIEKEYIGTPESSEVMLRKEIRFHEERLKVLWHNRKVLLRTQKQYRSFTPDEIHRKLPEAYKDLPETCYEDERCLELHDWAKKEYPKNRWPYSINATKDCNGKPTRSKGECIWNDNASFLGLDYQYDGKYKLMASNGEIVEVNPDLTIMTLRKNYIFVEHLGLLLEEKYMERFKDNVQKYIRCGYVPGDNLLFTADNEEHQTNSLAICQMIELIKIKVRES